jgi:alpha-D-xyloside xylohydrolase
LLLESGPATGKSDPDDTAYMFGPSILVVPFFEKQSTARIVKLPPGNWCDFYTGEFVGKTATEFTVTAEQMGDRVPLFVKEGAVIPLLTKAVRNTEQAYGHPLEVRHYGQKGGSCVVYEDDGKTFDFELGKFRIRQIDVTADGDMTESIPMDRGPAMFGKIETVRPMTK